MTIIPTCNICGKPSIKELCIDCHNKRRSEIYFENPINRERRINYKRNRYKQNKETIQKQNRESKRRRKERAALI